MTAPVTPPAAADRAAPSVRTPWRDELAGTMQLAWPMAATQLGQVAMLTTDLALIGRLGEKPLAAAALAHTVLFTAFVLGLGLMAAVSTLAAQAYGARNPRIVRRALRVGLWAATLVGVPLTLAQQHGDTMLIAFGQSPEIAALADRYLDGLAWSLMPIWWFTAIRNFMGAVKRPEPALWITLAAVPVNAVLAYALINGAFGLPALDLLGAGVGTTIVNLVMCLVAIWVCYARRPFKKYRVLGHVWRFDGALLRELLIVGVPISGAILLEWGLFAVAAQFMGWLGSAALAAHQIALQVASILFMVPYGISLAATVRVGHAVGRGEPEAVRRAGFVAIALGAIFMAASTLAVLAAHDLIALVFLGARTPNNDATFALTSTLLLAGATFFIADGVQTVTAGALRGLADTRIPLVFAAIGFWLIGLTASYGFGFIARFGAPGVWIGFTLGIVVYAILLLWRFHALTADSARLAVQPTTAATDASS